MILDTHALLWAVSAPERLSPAQVAIVEDPTTELLVSTISIAEIEIKRAIGKLQMTNTCEDLRESVAAEWLPLLPAHAMALRSLPLLHRDPFDRLLIAQAIAESKTFVTSDQAIGQYAAAGLQIAL